MPEKYTPPNEFTVIKEIKPTHIDKKEAERRRNELSEIFTKLIDTRAFQDLIRNATPEIIKEMAKAIGKELYITFENHGAGKGGLRLWNRYPDNIKYQHADWSEVDGLAAAEEVRVGDEQKVLEELAAVKVAEVGEVLSIYKIDTSTKQE